MSRLTRKSGLSDEDVETTLATCRQQVVRVADSWNLENDTTHGQSNGQHYTPQQTTGRPIRKAHGKLNVSRMDGCHASRTCRRGFTRMLRGNGAREISAIRHVRTRSRPTRISHDCSRDPITIERYRFGSRRNIAKSSRCA